MNTNRPPFSAALIAGGKSIRMRRDKRLIAIDGRPLWQRQIEILKSLNPAELVISGPLDGPWNGSNYKVIPDALKNAGPLAGLATVLNHITSPLLLVLAVDMPKMAVAYLESLLIRCNHERGIVPIINDQFEPLAAVYPRSCSRFADKQLSLGENSLQRFVQTCVDEGLLTAAPVRREEERFFENWNRPDDVENVTEIEK